MTDKQPGKPKPLRAVTVKCAVCESRFRPTRKDGRYCSAACRQSAYRSRAQLPVLQRQVEAARLQYWKLAGEYAVATGCEAADDVQYVDMDGKVYIGRRYNVGGRYVGWVPSNRPGWATWGLEAAGPPFSPPPLQPAVQLLYRAPRSPRRRPVRA